MSGRRRDDGRRSARFRHPFRWRRRTRHDAAPCRHGFKVSQDKLGDPIEQDLGRRLCRIDLTPAFHLRWRRSVWDVERKIDGLDRLGRFARTCDQTGETGFTGQHTRALLKRQLSLLLFLGGATGPDQAVSALPESDHEPGQLFRGVVEGAVHQRLALSADHHLESSLEDQPRTATRAGSHHIAGKQDQSAGNLTFDRRGGDQLHRTACVDHDPRRPLLRDELRRTGLGRSRPGRIRPILRRRLALRAAAPRRETEIVQGLGFGRSRVDHPKGCQPSQSAQDTPAAEPSFVHPRIPFPAATRIPRDPCA